MLDWSWVWSTADIQFYWAYSFCFSMGLLPTSEGVSFITSDENFGYLHLWWRWVCSATYLYVYKLDAKMCSRHKENELQWNDPLLLEFAHKGVDGTISVDVTSWGLRLQITLWEDKRSSTIDLKPKP